jgi:hypothetical protein
VSTRFAGLVGGTLAAASGCSLPPATIGEWHDSDALGSASAAEHAGAEHDDPYDSGWDEDTGRDPSGDTSSAVCQPHPLEFATCSALGEAMERPWDAVVEWQWGEGRASRVAPLVGHFVDDDGDGRTDADDSTAIVVVAAHLVDDDDADADPGAVDGCTVELVRAGGEATRIGELTAVCDVAPAFGDIDGDCVPEIVFAAVTMDGVRLAAVQPDGEVDWIGETELEAEAQAGAIALHDLDADGRAEVLFAGTIHDDDGSALGSYGKAGVEAPYAVDVDGDTVPEIVTPRGVWRADGEPLLDLGDFGGAARVFPIDGDRDGGLELWVQSTIGLVVVDPITGEHQEIGIGGDVFGGDEMALEGVVGGIVDDLDGDGLPELVGAWGWQLAVLWTGERVLSDIWWALASEYGGVQGTPTAFDLDGDGASEVIVVGEGGMFVVDGSDGIIDLPIEGVTLGAMAMPVVADVDDDDSAEIIVTSASGPALTVIGHAESGWAPARPVWNQVAASVTNVGDDGSIPSVPVRNWLELDTFGTNARVDEGRLCARASPN